MGEIGSRAVQLDESLGVAGLGSPDRGATASRCGPGSKVRSISGDISTRAAGWRDVGLQQQVDREMPARRVAGDDDSLGREARARLSSQSHPVRDIVGGGGESVPRRKAVVDDEHRQSGQA